MVPPSEVVEISEVVGTRASGKPIRAKPANKRIITGTAGK